MQNHKLFAAERILSADFRRKRHLAKLLVHRRRNKRIVFRYAPHHGRLHVYRQNVASAKVVGEHFQLLAEIVEGNTTAHDYAQRVVYRHHLFQFFVVLGTLALGDFQQLLFRLVSVSFAQGVDVGNVQPCKHNDGYFAARVVSQRKPHYPQVWVVFGRLQLFVRHFAANNATFRRLADIGYVHRRRVNQFADTFQYVFHTKHADRAHQLPIDSKFDQFFLHG